MANSSVFNISFNRGWPIFLFLIHAAGYAADPACHHPLFSEKEALAHLVDEANPDRKPIIVRHDLNFDGREDLLVGQACGNHGCEYSVFLARANGRYCLIDGELGMSVAPKLGLVDVQPEGSKPRATIIITWMSAGSMSGSYERYRLADGRITKLCEIWYDLAGVRIPGITSEKTAEAAKNVAEQAGGSDRCR